jgi:hypothetical protein
MSDIRIRTRCLAAAGDYTPDLAALLSADIIIATPEKWDGISRNWQSRGYVKKVRGGGSRRWRGCCCCLAENCLAMFCTALVQCCYAATYCCMRVCDSKLCIAAVSMLLLS